MDKSEKELILLSKNERAQQALRETYYINQLRQDPNYEEWDANEMAWIFQQFYNSEKTIAELQNQLKTKHPLEQAQLLAKWIEYPTSLANKQFSILIEAINELHKPLEGYDEITKKEYKEVIEEIFFNKKTAERFDPFRKASPMFTQYVEGINAREIKNPIPAFVNAIAYQTLQNLMVMRTRRGTIDPRNAEQVSGVFNEFIKMFRNIVIISPYRMIMPEETLYTTGSSGGGGDRYTFIENTNNYYDWYKKDEDFWSSKCNFTEWEEASENLKEEWYGFLTVKQWVRFEDEFKELKADWVELARFMEGHGDLHPGWSSCISHWEKQINFPWIKYSMNHDDYTDPTNTFGLQFLEYVIEKGWIPNAEAMLVEYNKLKEKNKDVVIPLPGEEVEEEPEVESPQTDIVEVSTITDEQLELACISKVAYKKIEDMYLDYVKEFGPEGATEEQALEELKKLNDKTFGELKTILASYEGKDDVYSVSGREAIPKFKSLSWKEVDKFWRTMSYNMIMGLPSSHATDFAEVYKNPPPWPESPSRFLDENGSKKLTDEEKAFWYQRCPAYPPTSKDDIILLYVWGSAFTKDAFQIGMFSFMLGQNYILIGPQGLL